MPWTQPMLLEAAQTLEVNLNLAGPNEAARPFEAAFEVPALEEWTMQQGYGLCWRSGCRHLPIVETVIALMPVLEKAELLAGGNAEVG